MGLDPSEKIGVSTMRESDIQNQIRCALSKYGIVFRTNAGEFWQGQRVYSKEFKQPILIKLRRVQGLPAGFSDLIFIGNNRIAFIETKRPGEEPRPEQIKFLERMRSLGHAAGVARSVEDALNIISGGNTDD